MVHPYLADAARGERPWKHLEVVAHDRVAVLVDVHIPGHLVLPAAQIEPDGFAHLNPPWRRSRGSPWTIFPIRPQSTSETPPVRSLQRRIPAFPADRARRAPAFRAPCRCSRGTSHPPAC